MKIDLDWYELLLWLSYVFFGLIFLFFYKTYKNINNNFLIYGYLLKVTGGLFLALVYIYYYAGGDTTLYYFSTSQFVQILYEKPLLFFELFLTNSDEAKIILAKSQYSVFFSNSDEEWFMMKLSSVFCVLGFNSYLGMTFFFSFTSFFGSLKLFEIFNKILPDKEKWIFRIVFLLPSVLIWGSGILKDTFTLVSFSFFCFYLYQFIIERKLKLSKFLFFLFFAFVLFKLKAYILFCLIPWIMVCIFLDTISRSSNPVAKFLIIPYLLIILFLMSFFGTSNLLESSSDYKTDQIMKKVEGFKTWHTHLGGSAYDLGVTEFTPIGLLSKAHLAINVTLFRPYIWESKTVLILFTAIESFSLLVYSIFVLIYTRLNFFKFIYTSPYLFGGFVFCLIFAFTIGVTSYNFGALSRFKIPLLSVYSFILYYGYISYKKTKLKVNEVRN
jgi:hypothetical protein